MSEDDDLYRPALTMDEALDPERMAIVGQIVMFWDMAERQFRVLTWELAGLDPGIGKIITHDLPNVALITLAKNLANHTLKDPKLKYVKHDVMQLIGLFDECRKQRNEVVHGSTMLIDDRIVFYRSTYKAGKGEEIARIAVHLPEDLKTLLDIITFCTSAIPSVLDSVKTGETPSYDRDQLQIYLAMLRSPHH
ncbi:MAG: hypothetical protein Kow0026_24080 [Oricola sp.]